jgi:EAL domain-containing protein (putative c-di-GMP-specific phosphodiesterase class I)
MILMGQDWMNFLELKPDYIKLNMTPFNDMAGDSRKYQEFIKTVTIVRQFGGEIICAKLESRADSFLAVRAGVRLGLGFLFARPSFSFTTTSPK